jgi:tetratricopeptide (TPR) repeat protein
MRASTMNAWLVTVMLATMVLGSMPATAQRGAKSTKSTKPTKPTEVDQARDEEARTRFTSANMAFADGRFEDALYDFKRAYELSGRPQLLFNIGSTAERMRRDEEALEAYEAYLELVPEAGNRRFVESRIELLRETIAEAERRATEEEAKSQVVVGTAEPEAAQPKDEGKRGIASRWWFWTIVVGVVAGGVATGVVLGTSSSSPDPFVGSDGMTYETLTVARW